MLRFATYVINEINEINAAHPEATDIEFSFPCGRKLAGNKVLLAGPVVLLYIAVLRSATYHAVSVGPCL